MKQLIFSETQLQQGVFCTLINGRKVTTLYGSDGRIEPMDSDLSHFSDTERTAIKTHLKEEVRRRITPVPTEFFKH